MTRTTLKMVSGFASVAAVALMAAAEPAAATPATKAKTVGEDMDPRRVFPNHEKAAEYLNTCATNFADFATTPLAWAGATADGEFDPAIYKDDVAVMVGVLKNTQGASRGVKCIYIAPIPTMAQIMEDSAGQSWAEKILLKELSHVAVRQLRTAEDVSTVVDQMPTTREAYITSARDGGGGIMEAFNELYKLLNATMAKNSPTWAKFKLNKQELKRALESKAYAEEYYPALENRGDKDSLFVSCLKLAIGGAAKKGLDPTIFQRWTETRDQKELNTVEESEDFDLEDITDAMLAEPEAEAPAADATATA